MNLERKNDILKRRNAKLQEQVDDLRLRLLEREEELNEEELREEYLLLIDELRETIDNVRTVQNEYDSMVHDFMKMKKAFEKEMFKYNPMMFFKVKNNRK